MTTPKKVEIELKNTIKNDPITIQQEVIEEEKKSEPEDDNLDEIEEYEEYTDEEDYSDDEYTDEDDDDEEYLDEDDEEEYMDEDDEEYDENENIPNPRTTYSEPVNENANFETYDDTSDDEDDKKKASDGFKEMYKANLEKAKNEINPDFTSLFLLLGGIILYKKLKKR